MSDEKGKNEIVQLRHIQTVDIPSDALVDVQTRLSLTKAIRAAGFKENSKVRYLTDQAETLGIVPIVEAEEGVRDASDTRAYTISRGGAKGNARRLHIPRAVLAALDVSADTETTQNGDLKSVDVYAGDDMLALEKSTADTLPTDWLPTGFAIDEKELVLNQVQTTTPRLHGGTPLAAITRAFKQAGGNFEAVEFLPELTDDLNGLVPAISSEHDGERETTRSIYRQGPNKKGASVSLPEPALAALGLSTADCEDTPSSERPTLAVYAGNGVIGFGHSGQREIALNHY